MHPPVYNWCQSQDWSRRPFEAAGSSVPAVSMGIQVPERQEEGLTAEYRMQHLDPSNTEEIGNLDQTHMNGQSEQRGADSVPFGHSGSIGIVLSASVFANKNEPIA
jgi:hypothetical protein